MTSNGTFIRFLRRNEKTGESCFIVMTPRRTIQLCEGIVQNYPNSIPLALTGNTKTIDGSIVLQCDTVTLCGYDISVMQQFLQSDEFTDIGPATAEKILKITGADIFAFLDTDYNIEEIAKETQTSVTAIDKCFKKLVSYKSFDELLDFLTAHGGNFFNTCKLYEKFQDESMTALRKNPYILLYADAPYKVSEAMAKEIGMEACDRKRTRAIVEEIMTTNSNTGNTKISFHELCKKVHMLEENAGCGYYTQPLFIGEEILTEKYHLEECQNEIEVYLADDYHAELQIAENISRLLLSASVLDHDGISVEDIEASCGVAYSEDQKQAFHLLDTSGVKVITGGPGTGKTTLLNGILKKYETDNPGKKVYLCAPTGCAARQMQESTDRESNTIHKLLDIRPYEKVTAMSEKLDADCLVVDECSMIDIYIMARLLASVRNGALVILLGDEDQLPSVRAGNVLGDIIASGVVEVYRLNTIFRQDGRNLIIDNSRKVIKGETNLLTDRAFQIRRFNREEDMITEAVRLAKQCYDHGIDNFKLYTPSRNPKFKSGSTNMNRLLKETRHKEKTMSVFYGFYTFSEGDLVMFNRNNYDKGYYNGQEGIIRNIQKHGNTSHISIETNTGVIYLSGTELEDMELGYAITAHKSQGGESMNAIILIPKKPASLLKRQVLYVEITRARKSVIILSEGNALEQAISSFMERKRSTGLTQMLHMLKLK